MPQLKVYYDGECPVCSREVSLYRRAAANGKIDWIDAARADAETLGADLSRGEALRRMHVRRPDGSLASGAAAFAELWAALPGFRWLGRLISVPPLSWAAEAAYRLFLVVRPLWRRRRPA